MTGWPRESRTREIKLGIYAMKKEVIFFFIQINLLIYISTLTLSSDTPEKGIGSHYR